MELFDPRDCESVLQRLEVQPPLEPRRLEFAEAAVRAHAIAEEFACRHGWNHHVVEPLYAEFEVVSTQADLLSRVLRRAELPPSTPLPTEGLAAALINGRLIAVTPEEYKKVRPEYASKPDSWARLLAHELIHVVHERAVDDNLNAMGPKWFFEGLAVFGAGQDLGHQSRFTCASDALDAVRDDSAGSYARFEGAVSFFSRRVPIQELVVRAKRDDFEEWLRALDVDADRSGTTV